LVLILALQRHPTQFVTDNTISSLAVAEMKILLREVYSQCRTTISSKMESDMEMEDQIIASRPKGQCCKLVFEKLS
jgi:tRNA threonylcarbamoyladenosine modification (KEOPS) complex Cgi121 subunit